MTPEQLQTIQERHENDWVEATPEKAPEVTLRRHQDRAALLEYVAELKAENAQLQTIDPSRDAIDRMRGRIAELEAERVWWFNQGYTKGHDDTVEGNATHIYPVDMRTYHADIVEDIARDALKGKNGDT